MQIRRIGMIATAFMLLAACAPPADDSLHLKQYPEPGSGLSTSVTANPLPVQTESLVVTDPAGWGKLVFDRAELEVESGSTAEAGALAGLIERYHRHWLDADETALRQILDGNITRFREGRAAHGIADVVSQIAGESRGERPEGHPSSLQLAIHNVRVRSDGDFASTLYRVAVRGGARWEYADLATVLQVFRKSGSGWKLIGHAESLGLDDPDTPPVADDVPNRRTPFRFDFAYPVRNLDRAIAFYTPLLGEPLEISANRATFRLRDSHFILETRPIDERMTIEQGYANGYAVIEVDSLAGMARRLSETGTTHLELKPCGEARCMVSEDPSGNVLVWRETESRDSPDPVRPTVSFAAGARSAGPLGPDLFLAMAAWMATDGGAVVNQLADDPVWIDDSVNVASGKAQIEQALRSRWALLDRGSDGIDGDLVMDNVRVQGLGPRYLVTFDVRLDLRSNRRAGFSAFVMQVWSASDTGLGLEISFLARAPQRRDLPVLGMDYTAYPATDLGVSGRYFKILFGSEPYRDNNWFGFWSTASAFGLIGEFAGLRSFSPIPHRSNGYADFNVRSADEIYAYLRKRGATFPLVLGINATPGIDAQPGYRQVLTVDPEGNLVSFSEYLEY